MQIVHQSYIKAVMNFSYIVEAWTSRHAYGQRQDIRYKKGREWIVKRQFARGNGTREDYPKKFSSHGPLRARNSRSRALIKAELRSLYIYTAGLCNGVHTLHFVYVCVLSYESSARRHQVTRKRRTYTQSTSCSHMSLAGAGRELS